MKRTIVNKDRTGKVIKDLSKVQLPRKMEIDLFKILNPELSIEDVKSKGAS